MKIFSPTISGSSQASGSLIISGNLNVSQGVTGSLFGTASWAINVVNGGSGGSTDTGSLLKTASVNLNTITFTKGDGSTFPITVDTGSGGGGSVGTLAQVTALGASTTVPITASIVSASSFTGSLFGTASWATNASTAILAPNYVLTSVTGSMLAPYVLTSVTGSMLAPYVLTSVTSSMLTPYLLISQTSSFVKNNQTSSFVQNSQTSSMLAPYVLTSVTSSFVKNNQTSSMSVLSSSFSLTSSLATRNLLTASVSSNTITFIKGDGSTFNLTVNTGSGGGGSIGTLQQVTEQGASTTIPITASIVSASSFTGSLFGTASWAINVVNGGGGGSTDTGSLLTTASANLNTITFTKGDSSQFSVTVDTGSGGGGPSYITPPFDTGSILYWDGTKVTGSDDVMWYDGFNLNINTGYLSILPETQYSQDVIIYGVANLEGGARIYQDTVADAIVVEKADVFGTSGSYGYGSHILRNFSSTGPTLTPGRIVYISGSGQWAEAVASSTGSSTGVLGVVTTTANQNNVLLNGMVRVSQSLAGFINGQPVYLATASAGTITQTPPSTGGHVARYVGYVIDSGSREIYFNPDFTWIQL